MPQACSISRSLFIYFSYKAEDSSAHDMSQKKSRQPRGRKGRMAHLASWRKGQTFLLPTRMGSARWHRTQSASRVVTNMMWPARPKSQHRPQTAHFGAFRASSRSKSSYNSGSIVAKATRPSPRTFDTELNSRIRQPRFDFLERIQLAFSHTGALLGQKLPCSWASQIWRPKRKRLALPWAKGINLASVFVHDAVAVRPLSQADTSSDPAKAAQLEFLRRHSQRLCDSFDILCAHPHNARFSAATIAASLALESQALCIPRRGVRGAARVFSGGFHASQILSDCVFGDNGKAKLRVRTTRGFAVVARRRYAPRGRRRADTEGSLSQRSSQS